MADWPSWEVFLRPRGGPTHQHVGAVHAPDPALALHLARDLYTRRGEGVSLWVARSDAVIPLDLAGPAGPAGPGTMQNPTQASTQNPTRASTQNPTRASTQNPTSPGATTTEGTG